MAHSELAVYSIYSAFLPYFEFALNVSQDFEYPYIYVFLLTVKNGDMMNQAGSDDDESNRKREFPLITSQF